MVIGPPIHDSAFIRKVYTKQYDYKKISQETIFNDLNNVVAFLKKYVIASWNFQMEQDYLFTATKN